MIHYAGENKPWNTEKVDFYDDFLENVLNTPWEKEIYYRQLPVATVVHNQILNCSKPCYCRQRLKEL
jgi:lipopolysaccharide biosynthesis glycosyltransferase